MCVHRSRPLSLSRSVCTHAHTHAHTRSLLLGTVRHNVLFGLPYDAARYQRVITSCALDRDFALFPLGDETPIGERGVTLSGGQKARVR
jgi:ABC-type multidrug transport system fused ATPase/permease subunit